MRQTAIRSTLIILTILGFLLLFWGWRQLYRDDFYPIKSVRFVGTYHHIKLANLKAAALPYVRTGYFNFDAHTLKAAIEQLPWVSKAAVIQRWPDSVEVRFREQFPVARWQESAVLNVAGVLFEPEKESIPEFLPAFYGDSANAKDILNHYRYFQSIVQKSSLSVKEIHVSPSGSWWLLTNNEITVHLGKKDLITRLKHFAKSYQRVFKSRPHAVESVDLRYPSGMAVKWRRQHKNKQKPVIAGRSTRPHVKKNG